MWPTCILEGTLTSVERMIGRRPIRGLLCEQIINLKGSEGIKKGQVRKASQNVIGKSHIQFKVKGKKQKKKTDVR